MNVTVNGITGVVEWEGFRKSRGTEGPNVVIRYQVPYLQGDAFADASMGGVGTPRATCPTNPTLYCLRADVDYFGERDDTVTTSNGLVVIVPGFDTATVTVEYGLLTWPQAFGDDPGGLQSFLNDLAPGEPYLFADCEIDIATDSTSVNTAMQTASVPVIPVTQKFSIRAPISAWRITRHQYPNLPSAQVISMVGQTNSLTFLGQPAGCVLFDGARTRQMMTSDGIKCQMFEMLFKIKVRDWNFQIRPDRATWDAVQDSVGNRIYTQTDLRPLLQ